MNTLSNRIPDEGLRLSLERALPFMQTFGKKVLTPEVLLYTYLRHPDVEAHHILRELLLPADNWNSFELAVKTAAQHNQEEATDLTFVPPEGGQPVILGQGVITLIHEGYALAQSRREMQCSTAHTLVMMASSNTAAGRILTRFGASSNHIVEELGDPTAAASASIRDCAAWFKGETAPPLYPRPDLLRDLSDLLNLSQARNAILIGQPGVGKRSLAYSLAQRIAGGQLPFRSLIELSEQALLENAVSTLRAGLRAARGGILFVPHLDRFFGGHRAEFPAAARLELQKAFLDPEVAVLGTSAAERYYERLADEFTVAGSANILTVPPADAGETTRILEALQADFEQNYGVQIAPHSLPETARLAARYLPDTALPGSAVYLLHRACVSAPDGQVSAAGMRRTVSRITGIPVNHLGGDERARYAQMSRYLEQRIIGQDEAVQAVTQAVQAARLGLKDPRRPIGSFLFLGPTGVGKSETAKTLARFMFGSEEALITFDMSEYMDPSSVNRLIGSPPGYVDSQAGGQLTNAVKRRPYSVILFDEVEKAAPRVFDLLLQIMDEGRLTSGRGEVVHFSECVILLTSNIGQDAETIPALNAHFRPEFLNRLDGIIPFHPLGDEQMDKILELMLQEEYDLLAKQGVTLELSDAVRPWLLARNTHPEWGARPLRRIIAQHLRAPVVAFLLQQDAPPSPHKPISLRVDVKKDQLAFSER